MRLWWKHFKSAMWLFTFKWQSGSETLQSEQCIILHWHVTATCSSKSFLTMVSLQFSFVQETTSKRQQSRCFCQWTTILNDWLQIARTCNQKYKQKEKRLWQACANIFLWMGGCPHEQECRKIDNSLLHVCLNILLFSGSMAVSDKLIKSCIWGNFKKSTLYTCTLWKIYMIMNINIIQMNTMGGPYQCALKSLPL